MTQIHRTLTSTAMNCSRASPYVTSISMDFSIEILANIKLSLDKG